MIKVVISQQHQLKKSQVDLLNTLAQEHDCEWSRLDIRATGWTAQEQCDIAQNLSRSDAEVVVFASPLPYMLKLMVAASAANESDVLVLVFHNDQREKREWGGKVAYLVAETGWELL